MHIHQTITRTTFPDFHEAVSAWWGRTSRLVRARWQAARAERTVSRLPAKLRHDIGELDCRPPLPPTLAEKLEARQTTLETMWLRHL